MMEHFNTLLQIARPSKPEKTGKVCKQRLRTIFGSEDTFWEITIICYKLFENEGFFDDIGSWIMRLGKINVQGQSFSLN